MDTRRLILFVLFSFSTFFIFEQWQGSRAPVEAVSSAPTAQTAPTVATQSSDTNLAKSDRRVKIRTALYELEVDTMGGDIRHLALLKHKDTVNKSKNYVLFDEGVDHVYVAQTGFVGDARLPTSRTKFTGELADQVLDAGREKTTLTLDAPEVDGIKVQKVMTFHRDSYLIDIAYVVTNQSKASLPLKAYYKILRDGKEPVANTKFTSTFTGAGVYTDQYKYQKKSFSDLDKGKDDYAKTCNNGWIAAVQHYFVSAWILPAGKETGDCKAGDRAFEMRKQGDNLYSIGTVYNAGNLAVGKTQTFTVKLFAGPAEDQALSAIDESLIATKDYGIFSIIAKPLYAVLAFFHGFTGNWGWAIILLTVSLKALFYFPSAASYRSMAKMKEIAPRMEALKEKFGNDKQKLSQATMEMYRTEKVSPLGGCLPMLIQIPVFMGLYWVLQQSVELRQAPWALWLNDLSSPDQYYVLPLLMAVSMWYQTTLNPPPTDPMQAKMMKIMPLMFSAFFFFSPSGLVIYWLVNNLLSIAQQKFIYSQIDKAKAAHA